MNIYVGNLDRQVTEEELRTTFESFGQVESATIIKDKYSGESREFGFVEMPSKAEALAAIEGLNGTELKEKLLMLMRPALATKIVEVVAAAFKYRYTADVCES